MKREEKGVKRNTSCEASRFWARC